MSIDAFAAVADRVLSNWTALKFAVEHGTAGNPRETATLKNELLEDVVDQCCAKPGDAAQLAELLGYLLETNFHVSLEDSSENEVAGILCELYRRIVLLGDLTAAQCIPQISHSNAFKFPEGCEYDSDSGSDEDDGSDVEMTVTRAEKPQPDADGWTVFRKK